MVVNPSNPPRQSNLWFDPDPDDVEPVTEDYPAFDWEKPAPRTKVVPEVCPCGIKVSTGLCSYHPKEGR